MDTTKFETHWDLYSSSNLLRITKVLSIISSQIDLIQVMQSLVKTEHKSLLVNCDKLDRTDTNVNFCSKVGVRLYNPTAPSLLNQAFCDYNWNSVIKPIDANSDSLDAIYNE